MNRIELRARLREVKAISQYDPRTAIEILCEIIAELNDELEEAKRK